MTLDLDKLLLETIEGLKEKMNLVLEVLPEFESLKYFRLYEISFILFFLATKTHKNNIKEVLEQYNATIRDEITYGVARHLVRRYYEEADRAKMMQKKAKQN